MTTFGQITSVADAHFTDALTLLRRPATAAELKDPGTIAAFTQLTAVLTRYADRTATGFTTQPGHSLARRPTAERTAELLRAAHTAARPAAAIEPGNGHLALAEPGNGDLALRLRATADALGCGLDLLTTHFSTTHGRGDSPTATVIANVDTGRHLLSLVGKYAAGLAHITDQAGSDHSPALKQAGALLAEAARHTPKTISPASVPVAAVAIRALPVRLPPAAAEDRARTIRGITTSAQRLIESPPEESITTWRATAARAVITHHLAARLLQQLTRRLTDLGHHQGAALTSTSAHQLQDAARRWGLLNTQLTNLTTQTRSLFSEPAIDANDLVLRLGRLLHIDPNWTPGRRTATTLTPTRQLAPDITIASVLVLTLLRAIDAFRIVADHHHTGIDTAHQAGRLWALLPTPGQGPEVYGPVKPKDAQALLRNYQRAQVHGNRATITLRYAVLNLSRGRPQAALSNQVTLLIRRAQARTKPTPAALATAAFPVPVAKAINTPVHTVSSSPPAPTPVPARGRST
ncbi:hypothetical protein ACRYCC_27140 [Actinomadura scrupuli]|uniref:hypothetical protein n=1 Tax=Actinomadura scrupuli TaxID=559629 RepID=UPI003D96F93C